MRRTSGTGGSSPPVIAKALRAARLITIAGGGTGAAEVTTNNIASVIQTVLAAQLEPNADFSIRPAAAIARRPCRLQSRRQHPGADCHGAPPRLAPCAAYAPGEGGGNPAYQFPPW
ncbi:MAG: hypothetical protein ABJC74_12580 [Gemmatimonadota bacterium]